MQNSTWKLAALAGVVGIGLLVVLQTQRGLSRRDVAVDEQAVSEDQSPHHADDPTADLGPGVAAGDPEPADAITRPSPQQSSTGNRSAKLEFGSDVAAGQSEPPPTADRHTRSPAPSTESANPFAPSAAASRSPHHSATGDRPAATKHDIAPPDDGLGLDFRKPGPKTPPAVADKLSSTTGSGNPFATVSPAASRVKPAGGIEPDRHATDTKPLPLSGSDAPNGDRRPAAKNPFATIPSAADSQASSGPALVAPSRSPDADQSNKPSPPVQSAPSKKSASPATSTGRENPLSPQPSAAFPDAEPPPAVASPSPKPDAFNPFEPAADVPSKTSPSPSAKTKTKTKTKTAARTAPDDPQKKPLPLSGKSTAPALSAGTSKTPRLIAPALPASVVKHKVPHKTSTDSAGSAKTLQPVAPQSIRALDKQPLPPKTPADRKTSATPPRQDRPTDGPTSPAKTTPPKRLDVPQQVAPLKTGARDLPAEPHTAAIDAPRGSQRPQLKIEKVAPPNAILGQPMIYHILVRNTGLAAAHQVVVKDQIPKGVQLTGTIPRAYLTGRSLSWRLGTLKPNEVRKIAVRVVPQTAGEIGSIATVNFVSKVAARTTVTAPKLSLAIDAPKTIQLGGSVQFHFKITNSGSRDARDVFIRDIIPPELSHAAGRDLEYKIGTLPAGKSQDVRLTMKAVKSGNAVNRAVVTAKGGLEVKAAAAVKIVDRTPVTISRTGPRTRYVGQTALYTNHVTNRAGRAVTGIRLVESVPAGMEVVKTIPAGRYNQTQRTITWTVGQLAAGQSRDLKVTLRSRKAGPQPSTVELVTADGHRATVRSQTTVNGLAALRIDVPPITGPVDVGNPVALRIVAANRGSAPATNVQITLTLSEELAVASVRGPVKYKATAAKITFDPIKTIAPGKEVALDVILRSVKPGDARVSARTQSDQMRRPLVREEALQILADGQ